MIAYDPYKSMRPLKDYPYEAYCDAPYGFLVRSNEEIVEIRTDIGYIMKALGDEEAVNDRHLSKAINNLRRVFWLIGTAESGDWFTLATMFALPSAIECGAVVHGLGEIRQLGPERGSPRWQAAVARLRQTVWSECASRASSVTAASSEALSKDGVAFLWCADDPLVIQIQTGPLQDIPDLMAERRLSTGRVFGILAYWPVIDGDAAAVAIRDELSSFALANDRFQVLLHAGRLKVERRLTKESLLVGQSPLLVDRNDLYR
ncbi:hypothetical protein AAIH70_16520 [Neorhizobium sp. BT27B]|uniref:hypothetical protein n=1 Tax=Neorhizobium sp. BT27B TaxID=3142625 RepID=UPI003D28C59E